MPDQHNPWIWAGLLILIFGLFYIDPLDVYEPPESEIEVIHEPVLVVEEDLVPIKEIECMAINAYHEARSQSVAGQLATMHVVLNRVISDKFPNTICGVVTQGPTYVNWLGNEWPVRDKCQFSWYCDGMDDTAKDVESYKRIYDLAEYVTTAETYDYTEGATHYHADYVDPFWNKSFTKVTQIDSHIFYRQE